MTVSKAWLAAAALIAPAGSLPAALAAPYAPDRHGAEKHFREMHKELHKAEMEAHRERDKAPAERARAEAEHRYAGTPRRTRHTGGTITAACDMVRPPFRLSALWPPVLAALLASALPASVSAAPSREENQAVVALLKSAIEEFVAGRPEQAASALERGLRIEPDNAILWHYLGQTRLHQGHYQEAESLAAKSNMLLGDNDALRARNVWLIAAARHEAGRNGTPPPGDGRQSPLQQRLDEETERRRHAETEITALNERLERLQAQCASSSLAPATTAVQNHGKRHPERAQSDALHASQHLEWSAAPIPDSHWPPPGQCRIWFPERPPGQQPPPGDCRMLKRQLPAGAWLVGS